MLFMSAWRMLDALCHRLKTLPFAKTGMTTKDIQFLSFDEAVTAAQQHLGEQFIALGYVPPYTRLEVYMIDVDADEPDEVRIQYEAGELFDVGGEEEFYDVEDVPGQTRSLFYARLSDLGDGKAQVMGMVSEHVLQQVLPGLNEDTAHKNEAAFLQAASTQFLLFWKQKQAWARDRAFVRRLASITPTRCAQNMEFA